MCSPNEPKWEEIRQMENRPRTPADVPARGFVCRVRMAGGGITYTTVRMTRGEAEEIKELTQERIRAARHNGDPFIDFPTAGQVVDLAIRADKVSAIQVEAEGPTTASPGWREPLETRGGRVDRMSDPYGASRR